MSATDPVEAAPIEASVEALGVGTDEPAAATPASVPPKHETPGSKPKARPKTAALESGERLYQNARSLLQKRAQAAEEAEKALTFTPRVNASKRWGRRASTGDGAMVGDRLYQQAMAQRKRLEEQRTQEEAAKTPSFTPEITRRARVLKKDGSANRFERLYKNAADIRKHHEEMAREELERQCTFRPKVNADERGAPSGTAFDRLYEPGKVSRRLRPESNLGGEARDLDEVARARGGHKGKPRGSPEEAGSRLHRAWMERQSRLAVQRAEKEYAELSALTFKPEVSEGSKHWAKTSRRAGGSETFRRLHAEAEEKRVRQMQIVEAARREELSKCSFVPTVSPVSRALAEDAERAEEMAHSLHGEEGSKLDRFTRLYEDGLMRQRQRALAEFNTGGEDQDDQEEEPPRRVRDRASVTSDAMPVHERLYHAARAKQAAREAAMASADEAWRGEGAAIASALEGVEEEMRMLDWQDDAESRPRSEKDWQLPPDRLGERPDGLFLL
jgi:hypothetical protein